MDLLLYGLYRPFFNVLGKRCLMAFQSLRLQTDREFQQRYSSKFIIATFTPVYLTEPVGTCFLLHYLNCSGKFSFSKNTLNMFMMFLNTENACNSLNIYNNWKHLSLNI